MKEVSIRGAKWRYQDINPTHQEVILLVHGHPFDHTMWKYQVEALNDFRLIVPDLKGYGQSDYNFAKICIEEQALDLALLLDDLKVPTVHLIGLSMGGQIIVELQRLFPQKVKSLILCASLPNAESLESRKSRLQLADNIKTIGMLEYTRNDIHKYINLIESTKESEAYKHLFKMMSETKVEGAVASHKGRAERRDNSEYVKHIKVPVLVVAGERDYFFEVDRLKSLADKMPNAHFIEIMRSGHLPTIEQPEIFNKAMLNFYSAITRHPASAKL